MHSPAHPLRLGEKNSVEIRLKGPHALCLVYGYGNELLPLPGDTEDEDQEGCVPVQRHTDGKTFIEVVPTELGEKLLYFKAAFADCALEQDSVHVTVVPSHPPLRLYVGTTRQIVGAPPIETVTVGEHVKLRVEAEFAGFNLPLQVPVGDVKYRLIQAKGLPAIRLDPSTGNIDAVRLGDALIESSYAGVLQTYCLKVREHEGYTPGNCEELREDSDRLLPTGRGERCLEQTSIEFHQTLLPHYRPSRT